MVGAVSSAIKGQIAGVQTSAPPPTGRRGELSTVLYPCYRPTAALTNSAYGRAGRRLLTNSYFYGWRIDGIVLL